MGVRGFALVSMTNKDVYYVSVQNGEEILRLLSRPDNTGFFQTTDIKSGATISIAISHVSSVVVKRGQHA